MALSQSSCDHLMCNTSPTASCSWARDSLSHRACANASNRNLQETSALIVRLETSSFSSTNFRIDSENYANDKTFFPTLKKWWDEPPDMAYLDPVFGFALRHQLLELYRILSKNCKLLLHVAF